MFVDHKQEIVTRVRRELSGGTNELLIGG